MTMLDRIEGHIRTNGLLEPGGDVVTQPLNGSDRAGEATQQGLVGQIAPLRNARHDQVLGHEEDDVFQGGGFDPQSAAHVGGETRALGDVPLPLALTHVVEKQRQNQTRRVSDLVERGSSQAAAALDGRSSKRYLSAFSGMPGRLGPPKVPGRSAAW
jgi:hypothetical protein